MPQHDELCRLPLLRTHFPAVNPLLSDTIDLQTDSKAKPPPFALIRFYAGKLTCRVTCGEQAGNLFTPSRHPAMHSSGPPCNTLVWWSRKVCKISSHSLQAFTIVSVGRFCL